jgi:LPS sulfotransferase NodH
MADHLLTRCIGLENIPKISYIIFSTPRSGSTLFCEALTKTRCAGHPDEHFVHWYRVECRPEQITPIEAPFRMIPPVLQMQRAIKRGLRNGVYGVKVMYSYYNFVENSIRSLSGLQGVSTRELLETFFPNLHYIHVLRRNKIRQSVSLTRAVLSNRWKENRWTFLVQTFEKFQKSGNKERKKEILYDFDRIHRFYLETCRQDQEWQNYFAEIGIEPYSVFYEDLIKNFETSIADVLRYLGSSESPNLKISDLFLKRQSDDVNEEWSERFERDLARYELNEPQKN